MTDHRTVAELGKAVANLDAEITVAETALEALREQRATVAGKIRDCCECDDVFIPHTERQIRCEPCQVASDF
jgi:hypothetical protein